MRNQLKNYVVVIHSPHTWHFEMVSTFPTSPNLPHGHLKPHKKSQPTKIQKSQVNSSIQCLSFPILEPVHPTKSPISFSSLPCPSLPIPSPTRLPSCPSGSELPFSPQLLPLQKKSLPELTTKLELSALSAPVRAHSSGWASWVMRRWEF